jgi:thiamine biosynthesis lipoprotein
MKGWARWIIVVALPVALVLLAAQVWNAGGSAQVGGAPAAMGPASPTSSDDNRYFRFSAEFFDTFDTLVTFTAFARDEGEFQRYSEVVRGEMERLHRLFDIYRDYEGLVNLKMVNDSAGTVPIEVDPSIIDLLDFAKEACEDTGGTVNVALGPVLAIWHDYRERAGERPVPSLQELREAAAHISVQDILIDRGSSTVFLRHNDMRLDVGALAKGYAVQKTVERLREAGLPSGLINAGGNVAVIGKPLDGREAWNIGVHAPTEDLSKLADVLSLTEGAAVTSGSDQRYFTAGGRRYHHIIDPETFFPSEGTRSVTVLHPDSGVADVLSTAAFILPYEKARALVAAKGAEALWVTEEGKMVMTEGYRSLSKVGKSNLAQERSVKP